MVTDTDFQFVVDEQYENEKGVFTVVAIKREEMVIRWLDGEEISTDVDLQRRIQERRQWEAALQDKKSDAKKQSSRTAGAKAAEGFEGLQPGDFKNSAAHTSWRGRSQLGGAVTVQLPANNYHFNSWAFAQQPETHWQDVNHRGRTQGLFQARMFCRLDEQSLIYGFYAERPDDMNKGSQDWNSFLDWLNQEEHDHQVQSIALDQDLTVVDLSNSQAGVLKPAKDGWQVQAAAGEQKVDLLAHHIAGLDPVQGIQLAICKRINKAQALARGEKIASDLADLFERLMPLYTGAITF